MKFLLEIDIDKPVLDVAKAFEAPEAMKASQEGFIGIEHLSGNKGEVGAKSKLVYKKFDLFETIISNNLPDEFIGLYEHKHTTNTMKVTFIARSNTKTRYITEIEYTRLNGTIVKIMSKIFPGMFKKQVKKWMKRFKTYVESN